MLSVCVFRHACRPCMPVHARPLFLRCPPGAAAHSECVPACVPALQVGFTYWHCGEPDKLCCSAVQGFKVGRSWLRWVSAAWGFCGDFRVGCRRCCWLCCRWLCWSPAAFREPQATTPGLGAVLRGRDPTLNLACSLGFLPNRPPRRPRCPTGQPGNGGGAGGVPGSADRGRQAAGGGCQLRRALAGAAGVLSLAVVVDGWRLSCCWRLCCCW